MDKLSELLSLCEYSVTITINDHRDYFQTVEKYLQDADEEPSDPEENYWDIPANVRAEMIRTNTIVKIQAYPKSANGFYRTYHYDLQQAIATIIQQIKEKK